MPIVFRSVDGLIIVQFQGSVTGDDLQRLADAYREIEARLEVTPDRVTDLSGWVPSSQDLPSSVLEGFGRRRAVAAVKNKVKSAIIAPNPAQYGLARMYQAYNRNPEIETMIFKDSDSACAWIGRDAKDVVQTRARGTAMRPIAVQFNNP
jgi:hypothetical protein